MALVRARLGARDALRRVRRVRPLVLEAAGEGTRVSHEETFLSSLAASGPFTLDVADYRRETSPLPPEERAPRFLEFLDYVESTAVGRGSMESRPRVDRRGVTAGTRTGRPLMPCAACMALRVL